MEFWCVNVFHTQYYRNKKKYLFFSPSSPAFLAWLAAEK